MKSNTSDSGSSQFEQIESVNIKEIPDAFRDSIAFRASMTARIGDANDIKTLKQKVKVLKAAVLKEREIKAEMEKKIEQITIGFQEAQKQIEKKEETIIYQEQELQQFREKLVQLGHQSNKYFDLYQKVKNQILSQNSNQIKENDENDSIMSSFKQIIGFSANNSNAPNQNQITEIQRLQKENFQLKEEIEKQKMAVTNAEQKSKSACEETFKRQIMDINLKIETLNKQNQEYKDKLNNITDQLQQKTNDLKEKQKDLEQIHYDLNSKNQIIEKMKNELEFTNDKCRKMEAKIALYLGELEQKSNKVTYMESQFDQLKTDKENLQEQVNKIEQNVMIFTLNKLNGNYQDPCQIICRKNLEGQHIMDFDSIKEKFSLNVLDIDELTCDYESDAILTIKLRKNVNLFFKGSSDQKLVEKKIRKFIQDGPSKRKIRVQ